MPTPRLRLTVALRLTLWYAAAFTLSSMLALAAVYGSVVGVLHERTDAELRQDLLETAEIVERGGLEAFRQEVGRERAGPDSAVAHLRLWSAQGELLAGVGPDPPGSGSGGEVDSGPPGDAPRLRTIRPPGSEYAARVGWARVDGGQTLELGQSLRDVEELLAALRNGMLLALPFVLLLAGPIGWFMARRALRGVEVVTDTARQIAAGEVRRRVPAGTHGDELDRLALAFNAMLDRIESLIDGMRDVTDDLAHDLRTPLARLRAAAERAATRGATPEDWHVLAETTTEECDRMLQVLNGTLEIAEADAGAARLALESVDLSAVAEEARDLFAALAEDAGVGLAVEAEGACFTSADRSRVQRIVANLLDNALKFTPAGGRVTLAVAHEGPWIRLDVRDTGAGVSATDLPRIFDRFYRGDGSRSGRGSGLGLSLARAFARAHGGELTARSTPGAGSEFTLRLRRLEE